MLQQQRKQQIDEGIALAKKIDAMREELLSLQKQRNNFIEGTKVALELETNQLYEKKISLQKEVNLLEEQLHGRDTTNKK